MPTMTTEERRERIISRAPINTRPLYMRAYAGKSRKNAIKAFCMECLGYSSKDVRTCTAPTCPLYEVRPFRREDEPENEGDSMENESET